MIREKRKKNLKIMARIKVRAGVILLIAEAKVGLLYLTPIYPVITYIELSKQKK